MTPRDHWSLDWRDGARGDDAPLEDEAVATVRRLPGNAVERRRVAGETWLRARGS